MGVKHLIYTTLISAPPFLSPLQDFPNAAPRIYLDAVRAWLSLCFPAFNLTGCPLQLQPLIFLIAKFPRSLLFQLGYCFLINCSLNNESSQILPNFRTYFSAVTTVLYYGWVNSKCQLKKETVSCHFNCCIPGLEWGVLQPRNLMQWYKVFGCIFRENMLWLVFLAFWAPGPRISVGVTADSPELAPFCFLPSRNCSVASANLLSTFPPCLEHRPQPEF